MKLDYPSLKEIHPMARIGILLLPFFLLWIGIYISLYSPKIKQIKKFSAETNKLDRELRSNIKKLNGFTTVTEQERHSWERIKKLFWVNAHPDEELAQLMEKLAKLALKAQIPNISFTTKQKAGLVESRDSYRMSRFQRMKREQELRKEGESQTISRYGYRWEHFPIDMIFNCGYQNLARFLESVKASIPSVELESIEIKREIPLISVNLKIKAYYMEKGRLVEK